MDTQSTISDLKLLQLVKSGDTAGLDALFQRYAARLFDFAVRIGVNEEDAKEIVSDIFADLWIRREQIEIRIKLRSYLYTAAKNRCLNHLRQKHLDYSNITEHELWGIDMPFEMAADHLVQQSEASLFEKLILESLPPKRLLVFRLHRLEGFSYKEIAKILSISENTVHKHMIAAIKQLADQYPVWKDILLSVLICLAFS